MDNPYDFPSVKISFKLTQEEYYLIIRKLNLGKYDWLCIYPYLSVREKDTGDYYIEAAILTDWKVDIPDSSESAD